MLRTGLSTASGAWEVKLSFSYDNSAGEGPFRNIDTDIIEIDHAIWRFHEMGIMPIGLRNIQSIINSDFSFANEGNFRIDIYARRTSGTANLYLDCLVPIPVDEGFCRINAGSGGNYITAFGFSPDNKAGIIVTYAGDIIYAANEISPENFVLPPGDGRMYVIYSDPNNHNITQTVTINDSNVGKYYERWLSLRGSE
jgi:hypothetical protein